MYLLYYRLGGKSSKDYVKLLRNKGIHDLKFLNHSLYEKIFKILGFGFGMGMVNVISVNRFSIHIKSIIAFPSIRAPVAIYATS